MATPSFFFPSLGIFWYLIASIKCLNTLVPSSVRLLLAGSAELPHVTKHGHPNFSTCSITSLTDSYQGILDFFTFIQKRQSILSREISSFIWFCMTRHSIRSFAWPRFPFNVLRWNLHQIYCTSFRTLKCDFQWAQHVTPDSHRHTKDFICSNQLKCRFVTKYISSE